MDSGIANERFEAMTHLTVGLIMKLGKSRVIRGGETLSLLKLVHSIASGDMQDFRSLRRGVERVQAEDRRKAAALKGMTSHRSRSTDPVTLPPA